MNTSHPHPGQSAVLFFVYLILAYVTHKQLHYGVKIILFADWSVDIATYLSKRSILVGLGVIFDLDLEHNLFLCLPIIKLVSKMDSSHQKTNKMIYCTYFYGR